MDLHPPRVKTQKCLMTYSVSDSIVKLLSCPLPGRLSHGAEIDTNFFSNKRKRERERLSHLSLANVRRQ